MVQLGDVFRSEFPQHTVSRRIPLGLNRGVSASVDQELPVEQNRLAKRSAAGATHRHLLRAHIRPVSKINDSAPVHRVRLAKRSGFNDHKIATAAADDSDRNTGIDHLALSDHATKIVPNQRLTPGVERSGRGPGLALS